MIYHLYVIVLGICFVCSLISFRLRYAAHLRLFSVLTGISVLTEYLALHTNDFLGLSGNYPVYNAYMLIEYSIYAFYFKAILPLPAIKKTITIFLFLFPLIWFMTTFFVFDIEGWNSYANILGDTFIVSMSIAYFYKIFTSENPIDLKNSPEFWITVASFFYFCCEFPITGIYNYLVETYDGQMLGLNDVLQLLNCLMYLIITYAFLCPLLTNTTRS